MIVIIPARFGSTRLPGKPLLDIAGRPMIAHVIARAQESGAARIVVATDDERIQKAVEALGVESVMTAATHASGTDRLAETVRKLRIGDGEVVVNVQGDEPLMPPALIREVAATLVANEGAAVATACHAITDATEFNNPNVVKVVRDSNGFALYFSRAPIPFPRNGKPGADGTRADRYFPRRHIGIYAYRAGFILRYAAWPICLLEEIEVLEQLRVLWHGERIAVCEAASAPPAGVDTQADLERVRRLLA